MTETLTKPFYDRDIQKMLFTWWAGLEKHHRGDRPELRRCATPDEVLLTEAYHRARRQLGSAGLNIQQNHAQLATVIGLLAHVRTHVPLAKSGSLGAQMAGSSADGAPVSGLRFRRLLQVNSRKLIYRRLIGVVRLLGQSVDINALAHDAYFWSSDADDSFKVRQNWAMDYYARAPQES